MKGTLCKLASNLRERSHFVCNRLTGLFSTTATATHSSSLSVPEILLDALKEINMTFVEIKYKDIPTYLHYGHFYRSLDRDDPEGIIPIPADCFHLDGVEAVDLQELKSLLNVYKYWQLFDIPVGAIEFCYRNSVDVWGNEVCGVLPDALKDALQPLLDRAYETKGSISFADIIRSNAWNLLKHAAGKLINSGYAPAIAARLGELEVLEYLHTEEFVWNENTCKEACTHGHLDCLEYAMVNGCSYNGDLVHLAAVGGNFGCLEYLVETQLQCLDEDVFRAALLRGDLICLTYLVDQGCPFHDAIFLDDDDSVREYDSYFKQNNHEFVLCVQFAVDRGWIPNAPFQSFVASRDSLCMEWLLSQDVQVAE